jgi:transposase
VSVLPPGCRSSAPSLEANPRPTRLSYHSRPNRQEDPMGKGASTEQVVREIHRRTRRRFSAEEKVRIVLEGLRGEQSVAELCRREGLAPNLYYRWSKEFLEAGKKRLLGDTTREATAPEVQGLRQENTRLKQALAETVLENRLLKKSVTGSGSEDDTCG